MMEPRSPQSRSCPAGPWSDAGLRRFSKYVLIGGATFLLDLLLLFVVTDQLHWNPVRAAALAFVIAVSVNYLLSRRFVVKGTLRGLGAGYAGLLLIAAGGVAIVTVGMHLLVEDLGGDYLVSRILIAAVTGVWNYVLNLYVNFQVAGVRGDRRPPAIEQPRRWRFHMK